jgi:hypothetical protein
MPEGRTSLFALMFLTTLYFHASFLVESRQMEPLRPLQLNLSGILRFFP